MFDLREEGIKSKAWPFEEARRLLSRYKASDPSKGYVLFQTGYGPSGLPHIGTFGEVSRTTMVKKAFDIICDIPSKLICFSDDLDGSNSNNDDVDPAYQFGNPNSNDWYNFTGFTLTYTFGRKPCYCNF